MDVEEVIRRVEKIPSYTTPEEIRQWHKYLNGQLPDGSLIVDFGTGWGKSACALGLIGGPTVSVLSLDTGKEQMDNRNVLNFNDYGIKLENFQRDADVHNVIHYFASCQDFDIARWLLERHKRQFEVWNLDCEWRDEAHTRKEIERWFPYLKTGGLFFAHSFKHEKFDCTGKAITELLLDTKKVEQLDIAYGGARYDGEQKDDHFAYKYGAAVFRKVCP